MKPEELVSATAAGAAPGEFTSDTIRRRITSLSKGLIEVRRGDVTSVQFIHQLVNDFLFRNKRLQKLDPTLEPDPVNASHGQL
ncbi:hypothetical protein MKZ38_005727 [Zalerion maritima]|uniref:Uncharacterized protein n=1 Tax=Zalerion maritima TaxID=339359 RepID=A0AAD5RKP0_9PEZI|nr:hypothetical protein MKZ38_005727 [Zalerion maritima]